MAVTQTIICWLFLLLRVWAEASSKYVWDEKGYVLYCPCMGRFGNQAAHFLGALRFAKELNRTLAVPPWRSYVRKANVPYSEWFDIEAVQRYHKALPIEDFITHLAPQHWPEGHRTGYCYGFRDPSIKDCQMKEGNPFGPFWDELGVEFDESQYTAISYDVQNVHTRNKWMEKFPPETHPVLAFRGAPASFPVNRINRDLQQYVVWNNRMKEWMETYVQTEMTGEPYVAVHLRLGSDWEKACSRAIDKPSFMESGQCLEDIAGAVITQELCYQSHDDIIKEIKRVLKKNKLRHVFIGSDVDPRISYIKKNLGTKISVHYLNPSDPPLDLALMSRADHFIGNCVSSFTAFVKRERDVHGLPTDFFGYSTILNNNSHRKTEL